MMTLADAEHIAKAVAISVSCAYAWRRLAELWLRKHPVQDMEVCPDCRGLKSFFTEECPHARGHVDDTAALRRARV